MAAKSILKSVVVKGNKGALNIVRALENVQVKRVDPVSLSKNVKELSTDTIQEIWGTK